MTPDPAETENVGAAPALIVFAGAHPDFALAAEVRRRVFMEEQHVAPEEEWDGFDADAVHVVALCDGEAVGTARFFDDDGWLHIGRVAVLPAWRSRRIGRLLLERCLAEGRRLGFRRAFLNAQSDKTDFYRRFGFSETDGEFLDAGIPHRRMEMLFEEDASGKVDAKVSV